jgi:hypothetical protein
MFWLAIIIEPACAEPADVASARPSPEQYAFCEARKSRANCALDRVKSGKLLSQMRKDLPPIEGSVVCSDAEPMAISSLPAVESPR